MLGLGKMMIEYMKRKRQPISSVEVSKAESLTKQGQGRGPTAPTPESERAEP